MRSSSPWVCGDLIRGLPCQSGVPRNDHGAGPPHGGVILGGVPAMKARPNMAERETHLSHMAKPRLHRLLLQAPAGKGVKFQRLGMQRAVHFG